MRDLGYPNLWNNLKKAVDILKEKNRPWADLAHDERLEIKRESDGWEMVDGQWVNDADPIQFREGSELVPRLVSIASDLDGVSDNIIEETLGRTGNDLPFDELQAVNRYALGAIYRAAGMGSNPTVVGMTSLENDYPGLRETVDTMIPESLRQQLMDLQASSVAKIGAVIQGAEFDAAVAANPDFGEAMFSVEPMIDGDPDVFGTHDPASHNITLSLAALVHGPENVLSTLVHEFNHGVQAIEGWAPGGNEWSVGEASLARLGIDRGTAYYRIAGEVMSRALEMRRMMTREERLGSLLQDTMDADVPAEDRLNLLEMRVGGDGSFRLQASKPAGSMFSDANPHIDADESTSWKATLLEWVGKVESMQGKTKDEIVNELDYTQKPIARVPGEWNEYEVADSTVFAAEGYFVDHIVNNHKNLSAEDVSRLPDVVANPDEVRKDSKRGRKSLIFIKKAPTSGWDAVVVNARQGRMYLFKSVLNQPNKPYQYDEIVKKKDRSGGRTNPHISTSGNQSPAVDVTSTLRNGENDVSLSQGGDNVKQSSAASSTAAETAKFFGDKYGVDMRKFGLDLRDDGKVDYSMLMDDVQRRMQLSFGDATFMFFDGRKSCNEMCARARSVIDANPNHPFELVKKVLAAAANKEDYKSNGDDLAVLYFHQMACEERFRAAFEAFAEKDLTEEESLKRRRELMDAEANLEESALALGHVKSSEGRALAANKMIVRTDYTYGGLMSRAIHMIRTSDLLRMADRRGKLTDEEKDQLRSMAAKLVEAEKKVRELTEKLKAAETAKVAEGVVDKAGSNARKKIRTGGKVESVDDAVAAAILELMDRQDLKENGAPINLAEWPQVYAGIQDLVRRIGEAISAEYAIAHPMKRMPIEQFERALYEKCDDVFGSLKANDGSRGKLTSREYMTLFADYDNMDHKTPVYDPVKRALQDIVRLSRMMEDLRRIKEGKLGRDQYGYAKLMTEADVDREMNRVRNELNAADRASGLSNYVTADFDAKASAMDHAKQSMLREIDALEAAIESGDPLPDDLAPLVKKDSHYDALKARLAEIRARYDAMFGVGAASLSDEEKLARIAAAVESDISRVENEIANTNKYGAKKPMRVSASEDGELTYVNDTKEIRERKHKLAQLNRQLEEARLAANPEMAKAIAAGRAIEAQRRRQQHYEDKIARINELSKDKDKNKELNLRGRTKNYAWLGNKEWREAWSEANKLRDDANDLLGKLVYDRQNVFGKAVLLVQGVRDAIRSNMASGDESFIGVQAAWYMIQHPLKAAIHALRGAKAFASNEYWEDMSKRFLDSPRAQMILEQMGVKVPLANYGYASSNAEEMFARNYVSKKKLGILGHSKWLRASERGFDLPAMMIRVEMANKFIDYLAKISGGEENIKPEDLKYAGRMVNAMTGAGDFFGHPEVRAAFNIFLWAPGRLSGQLQTIFMPGSLLVNQNVSSKLRWKIFGENYVGAIAKLAGIYMMASLAHKLFGDDDDDDKFIEWDPTSPKFGKIHIGDRYISITGNMEQYVRLFARPIYGMTTDKNGIKREYSKTYGGGFWTDLTRTIRGKLRPDINAIISLMDGRDAIGRKIDKKLAHAYWEHGLLEFFLKDNFMPLTMKEIIEVARANGFSSETPILAMMAWIGITGADYGETPYSRAKGMVDRLDQAIKDKTLSVEAKRAIRADTMNRRIMNSKQALNNLEKSISKLTKEADAAETLAERDKARAQIEKLEKRYVEIVYWKREE